VLDDPKVIQDSKSDCEHHEEIHGSEDFAVVAKKSCPKPAGLIGRRQMVKVSRHCSLRNVKSQFEKLAMDSGGLPRWHSLAASGG
jgi:hypothetical protein